MVWIAVNHAAVGNFAELDTLLTVPVICTLLSVVVGYNGGIPIGAIFDSRDIESQKAFEHALANHKLNSKHRDPHFQLNVTLDTIDITDNFQMASAMCRQMTQGVFAILGQKSIQSADIVKSLSSTFHMPFITLSLFPSAIPGGVSRFELHVHPDYTEAMIDIIDIFAAEETIHFMYDSDEGLQRVQNIYKMMSDFSVIRLDDVRDVHDELRMIDASDNCSTKVFVLDLSSDEAYSLVLRQISEVGMNKFGYMYILATLDYQSMKLSRFWHGGGNVTGFQLLESPGRVTDAFNRNSGSTMDAGFRPNDHGLKVHAALTVDGLRVIEDALSGMLEKDSDAFRWIFRRGDLYNQNKTRGIPCTTKPPIPWMFGNDILNMMKSRQPPGLSGSLTFTQEGFRKDFSLGVYSIALDEGIQKIGTWSPKRRFVSVHHMDDSIDDDQEPRDLNGTKIITSILQKPFLMDRERKNGEPVPMGNDRYEGFSMDLANELAREIGFTFQFRIVADNNYGNKHPNDSWNGMIGELLNKLADLAVAPLTITAERERYVDFSKHFMEMGITIMIKKPQSQRPGVFSFMEPLSIEVWLCIIFAYLTVSIGLFLVSRFSPVEWKKIKDDQHIDWTKVKEGRDGMYHNDFSLFNSFWFSMGALMFQGSDTCPRSISGRIIGGAWWFFVLIIISSYTANLAAFLTIERMISPIESADDLVHHPTIKYGAVSSGTTYAFFKNSEVPVYKQMGEYMKAHTELMVQSSDEGVKKVRESKGKYAFLAESSTVDYFNEQKPCDTVSIGGKINNIGFGVATPRHSPLRDRINVAVLKLKEDGTLYTLNQKWWVEKGQCGGVHQSKKSKVSLTLSNVAGIFYILIVGLVFAIVLGVFEFMCFRAKNKTPEPPCHVVPDKFPESHRQSLDHHGYIGFEKFQTETADIKTDHEATF